MTQDTKTNLYAWLLWLLLAMTAITTVRPFNVEELVVHNAAYMVSEYNKVSFPVYDSYCGGSWNTMWVHPPLHYIMLGLFLKLTSVAWALNLYHLLLVAILFIAILKLKVPNVVKLVWLSGVFMFTMELFNNWQNFSFRPELAVSYTLLAGVLFLEVARQHSWNWKLLLTGVLLVYFASFTHYFAYPAISILGVYAYYYWVAKPLRFSAPEVRVFVLGSAACMALYIVFFLAPNFYAIKHWLLLGNSGGPVFNSWIEVLQHHIKQHADSPAIFAQWKLPAGITACAVLLLFKHSRHIALAILPYMLALVFVFKVKKPYYAFPESIIAEIALLLAFVHLALAISSRLSVSKKTTTVLTQLFLLVVCLQCNLRAFNPSHTFRIEPHPENVVRSVSQLTVSDSALIGGRHGLWYVSGAYKWYNEESNLWMNLPENLSAYLKGADFFCAYHLSEPESRSWALEGAYYCGDIQLKAVTICSTTPFCTYSAKHVSIKNDFDFTVVFDSVFRYLPNDTGRYIAGSFPLFSTEDSIRLAYYADYYFTLETKLCRDKNHPYRIGLAVMPVSDFDKLGLLPLQFFRAGKKEYTLHNWLELFPVKNTTVKFYKTQSDALARDML